MTNVKVHKDDKTIEEDGTLALYKGDTVRQSNKRLFITRSRPWLNRSLTLREMFQRRLDTCYRGPI